MMRKVLFVKGPLAVAIGLAMLCSGCSTAWVSTVDSILAAAAPALINILQIVSVAQGAPLNAGLETKINVDAAAIKTLAADFAKVSSGTAAGVCQQLQAAIGVYASDQQLVLQAAQVSDARTQAKITMLVELVAGTFDAITSAIPSCQNAAAVANLAARPSYRLSSFVSDYNRILLTPTGNLTVDAASPKLILHRHSKFMRFSTLGILR
jgi:hypothetical protein